MEDGESWLKAMFQQAAKAHRAPNAFNFHLPPVAKLDSSSVLVPGDLGSQRSDERVPILQIFKYKYYID